MATRKQKIRFAFKRFKGFWNEFKRSKRGLIGLIIITFFAFVAIFAPVLATHKPIDPQMGIGEYPGIAGSRGIKIAEDLCKPLWYKYLPFISRGEVEVTERFYTIIKNVSGHVVTFYAHEGVENASDTNLLLLKRVASIDYIKAIFPNGTERQLADNEWEIAKLGGMLKINEIHLLGVYPSYTKFEVKYKTGVDLVENMKIVNDNTFDSDESMKEWITTANPASAQVQFKYNNEKGFVWNPEESKGCMEISYTPSATLNQTITVAISKLFKYPYYQPPVSFITHVSIKLEGQIESVKMRIYFTRIGKDGTESFLVAERTILRKAGYEHVGISSSDPQTARNVKVDPPQDAIFATPGNYSYVVELTIPKEAGAGKIYLDNVDAILYGNIFGLMGTDNGVPFPRDIYSLLVYGSRVSLFVGVLSALFGTIIGLFAGLVSGYLGGIVDEAIMRFADLLLVLPTLPLFIVLVVSLRTVTGYVSMWNIIIILTLFGWMGFARSVRSMVLSLKERAFIEAAKAAGAGKMHIINRHILPNVFALVYVTLATSVPGAIITEASLSWLGLGDPLLPSWGKILYDFNSSNIAIAKGLTEYWFWIFPACIAIALLATAFILVGYAMDEILNPKIRERR